MRLFYRTMLGFAAFITVLMSVMTIPTALLPCRAQESGFDKRVKQPVSKSIDIRQATQKQEEQWRAKKQKLIARYEQLGSELKQLEARKQELDEQTAAARQRVAAKQKQLADIEQIKLKIIPLMEALVEELRQQIEVDLPFLPEERSQRLKRLEELRHDPDVAVSEKFRKVMEALLVEAEYGNTIEVYQQTIAVGERHMLVNIFRLGRISLFFQTLDQKTCGFYNIAASAWQSLPPSYNRTIQVAVDIGAKRQPVEMLALPLGRMAIQ